MQLFLLLLALCSATIEADLQYIEETLWPYLQAPKYLSVDFKCGSEMPVIVCRDGNVVEFRVVGQGLRGNLPVGFARGLPALEVLNLSYNSLGGYLGLFPEKLQKLSLQYNNFVGPLPPLLPASLKQIYVSQNNLWGTFKNSFIPADIERCYLSDSFLLGETRKNVNCFDCTTEERALLPAQCVKSGRYEACNARITAVCATRQWEPPPPLSSPPPPPANTTVGDNSSTPPPSPPSPSAAATTTTTTTPIGGHTVTLDAPSSSAASAWSSPLAIVGALVLLALLLCAAVLLIAYVACRRRRRRRRSQPSHQSASPRVRRGSSAASTASARAVSSTPAASRGASRTSLRTSQTVPTAASRRSRYQELELRRSRVSRHQRPYEDWRLRPVAAEAAAYDVAVLNNGGYDDANARFTTTTRAANAYDAAGSPFKAH